MTSLFSSLVPSLARRQAPACAEPAQREPLPTVKPAHEIHETADAFGVTVHLPGVSRDGLEISAEQGSIRITGRRSWRRPEAWVQRHRETSDATFELELTHDNLVDLDKIHAELRDGVLRVSLPKAEAVKPRKIAVT